jgi:hypothetical protein
MNFHFSAGDAKEWLTDKNQTLTKNTIYDLIQENNGLYALKGKGSYITGASLNPATFDEMLTIQYDIRLDGSVWGDSSRKQIHEDDTALMKVYGADFDARNLKTTTPYLL